MEMNLALISSLSALFIAGFNAAIFVVIKFNDLKHLDNTMQEIKTTIGDIKCKVDNSAERISKVEGILATRGKKK